MPTCFHARRLPWSYPGAKCLYSRVNSCKAPTLDLPWSRTPVCPRAYPAAAYPGAYVCAYPGPTLEPKRPPCRGSRVGSPAGLGRFPLLLLPSRRPSLPLPPARPKAPGSPKNPPPPPTLELALDPGRAPRGGCERAGDLGGRVWARGPIRIFRKKNLYGKPAKSTHGPERAGRAYPGATLEPAGEDERETKADERSPEAGEGRDAYPGAGDRPTLHLPAEGRSKTNQPNQTHQRTPTRPPEGGCVGEIEAKYGLPSADRNNKATLLLTGPFRTAKSSAKDLTPLVLKLQYAKYRGPLRGPRRNRLLRH